ncbi:MAG: beta-mannosidase [Ruminococcus sp.]|nr:beta-mannosidase [Ruminococcus sp.]
MKTNLRKSVCALTAAVMLLACGCGDKGSSSEAGDSAASSSADGSSADDGTGATTTRQRENIPLDPVTETRGDFDLSDVQNESDVPADFELLLEAEEGKMSENTQAFDLDRYGEFTGKGFAAIGNKDETVELEAELPADGSYDLIINTAVSTGTSENFVTVDGKEITSFSVEGNTFHEVAAEKIAMTKGKHTIGIKAKTGSFFVDSIKVKGAALVDLSQYEVSKQLCNPNATDETKRLYSFLCDVYGKYIISGQYADKNRGVDSAEFSEYDYKLGKYPAIMGLDLIEASPSRVANGSSPGNIVQVAEDWYLNRGGIVTICWHWNAPEPYLGTNGAAWWEGFYKDKTSFNLAKAISGEDKEGYDYLIRDIDAIAMYLQELDDYHVPVLWRPLHEGGGDPKWNNPWFWWGSSGAEAYKELWKLMYDRLTNVHHCNNLIWVWNGQNLDYYPGDEYVDMMGYDSYPEVKSDHSPQKKLWDYTKQTTPTTKIMAMTENGAIPDPDSCMSEGIRWSYFCTWNGEFALKDAQLGCESNSYEFFEKIMSHERVLTLDELPDIKSWPIE